MAETFDKFQSVFDEISDKVINQIENVVSTTQMYSTEENSSDSINQIDATTINQALDEKAPLPNLMSLPSILSEGFSSLREAFDRLFSAVSPVQNLLFDINRSLDKSYRLNDEWASDQKRRDELEKVKGNETEDTRRVIPSDTKVKATNDGQGFFESIFGFAGLGGLKIGAILGGVAIAPLVYKFADVFLNEITDGLIDLTPAAVFGSAALWKPLTSMVGRIANTIKFISAAAINNFLSTRPISTLTNSFKSIGSSVKGISDAITNNKIVTTIKNVGSTIKNVAGKFKSIRFFAASLFNPIRTLTNSISGFTGMLSKASGYAAKIFGALPGFGLMKTLLGRLAWPITAVLGVVDAVKEWRNTDGTIYDKFMAGLGGFFSSVIGAPFDLLKGAVSWILKKFGWENASEFLNSFSISDSIKDLFNGIDEFATSAVNWVVDLFKWDSERLSTAWKGLKSFVSDSVNSAIGWVSGLFKWSGDGIQTAWNSFSDLVSRGANDAISWVKGLFSWNSENLINDFNLTDSVAEKWDHVKNWFADRLSWTSEGLAGGWTNLTDLIKTTWASVRDWITSLFEWNSEGLAEGWKSISDTIKKPVEAGISWIKGLFADPVETLKAGSIAYIGAYKTIGSWLWDKFTGVFTWLTEKFPNMSGTLSEGWGKMMGAFNNIGDWVWNSIGSAIQWIKDSLSLGDDGEIDSDFSLKDMFDDVIEDMKTWFGELFNFLPSIDDIKQRLTSYLPDWMKPESIEDERSRIESELSRQRELLETRGNERTGGNPVAGFTTREDDIQKLEKELADIPPMKRGGFINAPKTGGLLMAHGAEVVAPLSSPEGKAASAIDEIVRVGSAMGAKQSYMTRASETNAIDQAAAARAITNVMPNIVNSKPVTNNSSSTTIINNMSPARSLDDPEMLK